MNLENSPHLVVPDPAVLDMLYSERPEHFELYLKKVDDDIIDRLINKTSGICGHFRYIWGNLIYKRFNLQTAEEKAKPRISCKIFEHFALQVDLVIEFIQPGSTAFKDSAILAPKLADPPFWRKSNSTPSKSGSSLPDPNQLIFCTI
jgi:hypothetical protein